jgi:hypothetical protein
MKGKTLKSEVAAKYNLVGVEVGKHIFNGLGEIDLAELKLDDADNLVANGFKYLVLKKSKALPAQ